MGFLVVPLLLALVGLIVTFVGRVARRKRRVRAFPKLPAPTFKVVALGNSGSGKTVLLASLFYQFRARPGRPYYFDTDPATRVWLGSLLSTVVDPTEPWPSATTRSGTRTYTFDCVTQVAEAPTTAFSIEYVDYAGEIFELLGEGDTALDDLVQKVATADALIGVLDGRRVLQFLRGEAQGRAYVIAKIAVMVQLMAKARCAIYFVISKWDLVHGFGEPAGADDRTRLDAVVSALMTVEHLSDLVRSRTTVRLIPVSAVGSGFARLDESTGLVTKRSDGNFAPYNVDIPIAAIVPDLFTRIRESMDSQVVGVIESEYRARRRHTPDEIVAEMGAFLLRPAGAVLRASLDSVLSRPYSNELVVMVLDWIARPSQRKETELAAFRAEAQRQAFTLLDARTVVLDDFQAMVQRLQLELPASVLSR
jgi:hypothetical protein